MFTNWLEKKVDKGLLYSKDKEIIIYGLRILDYFISGVIYSLTIAIIFNVVKEMILFLFIFIPLRVFSGGFHMKSKKGCMIFSLLIMIVVSLFLKCELQSFFWEIVFWIIGIVVILKLAPVDSENKPLMEAEKRKFSFIIRIYILGISISFGICVWSNITIITKIICISLIVECLLLILGYLCNTREAYHRRKFGRIEE